MFPFFLQLWLLISAIGNGFRKDPEFRAIFVSLSLLVLSGAVFYNQVEGWSFIDGLYFCIVTVATVGYGDLSPTETGSKLFTIFLIVLGVGLFAAFVGKIVSIVLADDHRPFRLLQRKDSRKHHDN